MTDDVADSSRTRNRLLIQRFYNEMWNRFDKSVLPQLLTEDIRFRGSLGQHKTAMRRFRIILTLFNDA
jgi:hypothetical protein